jgi:hypothetical protein
MEADVMVMGCAWEIGEAPKLQGGDRAEWLW